MQGSDRKIQQDNRKRPVSFTVKCVVIGFWGGLIMSAIGYFAYLLNFTTFGPALVLAPLALGSWKTETTGQIVGIFVVALLSILTALVYKFALARWYTMWVGVVYGAVIWFIVFYVLNSIFPSLEPFDEFNTNTLVTTMCLYILYGLFIGYSICFDYHQLNTPSEGESNQGQAQEASDSDS